MSRSLKGVTFLYQNRNRFWNRKPFGTWNRESVAWEKLF